ncbi:MAG: BatD family protein, partial [Betaproteobacteria bacterium]
MQNSIAKTQCAKCACSRISRSLTLALGAVLGMGAMLPAASSWAAVSARFDRNSVPYGNSVTLIIESDGSSPGDPDLSPLRRDFAVLGTSTSTQLSFVNGRRSDLKRWVVRLQPRRPGTISIPPIALGNDHTSALELTAAETGLQAAAQGGKHAFLEVEGGATGKPIYVQQQVPYTVRLFYDDTVEGQLAAPSVKDAMVEQLGDESHDTVVRDGKKYNVIERHYAVAPEKSGTLRIPAATFHGRAAVASANAGGDADADTMLAQFLRASPFANDPMFKNGLLPNMRFADEGQPVAVSSREVTLDVRPRPPTATGHWLPAEQVALHDSWADNPPRLKVGEPVTRTITINVKGLAASQIPAIQVAPPEHGRLYPETPANESRTDGRAVYGTSKQSVTYIPAAEGTLTVPA